MRLFEAIFEANHRVIAGVPGASVCPAEYADEFPVVALTCVDPRLNRLLPNMLGLPGDQFIWLRNAGNIITAPQSSTMRSLSLACAIKGGKEIVIIGHTDCQVAKTTTTHLLERLKELGIDRGVLPENLNDFFGVFGSESHNVIKACEIARQSPLIGPNIPVQGLIVDIHTGKLEWVVNGYEKLAGSRRTASNTGPSAPKGRQDVKATGDFKVGVKGGPGAKVDQAIGKAEDWLERKAGKKKADVPTRAAARSK